VYFGRGRFARASGECSILVDFPEDWSHPHQDCDYITLELWAGYNFADWRWWRDCLAVVNERFQVNGQIYGGISPGFLYRRDVPRSATRKVREANRELTVVVMDQGDIRFHGRRPSAGFWDEITRA
jgi:hypothetical protein